jgi:hypothetical protein
MKSSSTSKMPSGINIDIDAVPKSKANEQNSFFGFSSTSSPDTSSPSVETISPTTTSKNGFFKSNGNSFFRIGVIVIILLFLGVNIFSYLGDFLQNAKDSHIIQNIFKKLGYGITQGAKEITEVTADTAKLGVNVAAGTVESGIDVIQGQLDIEHSSLPKSNIVQQQNPQSSSLNIALADAEDKTEPQPDDATSSTQRSGNGKSGYCYIGEDRGFRSCVKVTEQDICMSGDIFPSQNICVNPSLRE